MKIYSSPHYVKKKGFLYGNIAGAGTFETLVITENDTEKYVRHINENSVDSIMIDIFSSNLDSIDFIQNIKCLKNLTIVGDCDMSIVHKMPEIQYIKSMVPFQYDFEVLINLRELVTTSHSDFINVQRATKLETVKIINNLKNSLIYNKTLYKLSKLPRLRFLLLDGVNLVENYLSFSFDNLEVLSIRNTKNISSLDWVRTNQSLEFLEFRNCQNLNSFDDLIYLPKLIILCFDEQEIKSLGFLSKIKNLSKVKIVNSHIMDGDITNVFRAKSIVLIPKDDNLFYIRKSKKTFIKDWILKERELFCEYETILD